MRRLALFENLTQDVRYAVRTLRRSPGFAFLGILVMALGIGANTAVFSVVNTVLLKPLAYADPDRIVTIDRAGAARTPRGGELWAQVSVPDFQDLHDQASTFEAMAYYASRQTAATTGDAAAYARATRVSAEFLRVFGVTPIAGREFSADEVKPRSGGAAIVSYAYAQRQFGGPIAAMGRTIRAYGQSVAIVGVMPPGFDYPTGTDFWFPVDTLAREGAPNRGGHNYRAVGRLKAGVTLETAQAEVAAIAARLEQLYPDTNKNKSASVTRLRDQMVWNIRQTLYVLLGTVALVLLIACANMATLLLAKATARTPEMAVRAAMGAGRMRLVRQVLAEGLVQALLAGSIGLLVAVWGTRALIALAPGGIPRLAETTVDGQVLAFTLIVSMIVSVLFALPPALHAAHVDVSHALRLGASRTTLGGRAGRVRQMLVVAEIALAVVLLAGGGLLIRSFLALQHVSLGFQPERVLVMDATAATLGTKDGVRLADEFFKGLLSDIGSMPGVTAVGAAMAPPSRVDSSGGYWIDRPFDPKVRSPETVLSVIAPGTFATLGMPLTRGRDFRNEDMRGAPLVTVINETLARQAFGDRDPLGHQVVVGFDSFDPMTIIGVVGDVRQYGPARAPVAEVFMPYLQHGYNNATLSVLVRSGLDTSVLTDSMRRFARARSAEVPVRFTTMEALLSENVAAPRFRALLVGLFAVVALCLSMAGIYGIMAFVVGQRSSEIGLRMALGATRGQVLGMLLRQGLTLTVAGLTLGLLGAAAATRLLATLLFEVRASDPVTYAGVAALLVALAMIATVVPARRSIAGDPVAALRRE